MNRRLALAALVTILVFSAGLSAQPRGRGYAGVTVFEHPNFRGTGTSFRGEIADLREYGLNDRISSLDVDGNQAWEVCQDVNFGGRCRVFAGSIDDLRQEGWNDRISSIRPAGFARSGRGNVLGNRGSHLVFYDRPNYRGESRVVLNGVNNLGAIGDRARSVEVVGAGTWELCDDASRNARCVTVSRDVPDLRNLGLRNGVTSVREAARQGRSRWW